MITLIFLALVDVLHRQEVALFVGEEHQRRQIGAGDLTTEVYLVGNKKADQLSLIGYLKY